MRDGIDFQRDVARFSEVEAAYLVEVLRGAYKIATADGGEAMLLGDFIEALEDCCTIEFGDVEEVELLRDEH